MTGVDSLATPDAPSAQDLIPHALMAFGWTPERAAAFAEHAADGLAAAAAEMAFAGGFGVEVQLDAVPTVDASLAPVARLFSESNTRFLCEVAPEHAAVFEGHFATLPVAKIGVVTEAKQVRINSGSETLIDAVSEQLKEAWQRPLRY